MKTSNNTFFRRFESVNALVAYLDEAQTSEAFQHAHLSSQTVGSSEFYGYDCYDTARTKLLLGDPVLAKAVRMSGSLNMQAPATASRIRLRTAVAGFAPHVPNYLAGVTNNMLFVERQQVVAPVITIIYNTGIAGGIDGDDMEKASARLLSAICSLERKGIRCNLYVASAQEDEGQRCGFIMKIKESGQHMDVLKMALPMMSRAMNRRFGFRFRETMPGLKKSWVGGYGRSMRGSKFTSFLNDNAVKYDVALSAMDVLEISTVEELEQYFKKQAEALKR